MQSEIQNWAKNIMLIKKKASPPQRQVNENFKATQHVTLNQINLLKQYSQVYLQNFKFKMRCLKIQITVNKKKYQAMCRKDQR